MDCLNHIFEFLNSIIVLLDQMLLIFLTPNNWSLEYILTLISLIFAIIGGFFALRQWIKTNRVRRAEFLDKCIEKLRFTDEFREAFYLIEYNQTWYSPNFHGSDDEPIIDGFLSYLSYICYLHKYGHLSKRDMIILNYYLQRVCISFSVQSYLWNVHHWSRSQNTTCSFSHLIEYGIKKRIINKKEFRNINSKLFIQGLHIPTHTK